MLNKDLNIDWDESDHNVRQGLIQYENIIAKEMFYNDSEKKSIDALCNMLQVDAFKEIQSRLADNGMRKGFACCATVGSSYRPRYYANKHSLNQK